MPRKRIITGERVRECILNNHKPFVTTRDIADYLDVTTQSVRNMSNELKDHPWLECARVGKYLAFYLPEDGSSNDVGRDRELRKADLMDLLANSEHPLTVSMISEDVKASRRTVHDRIMEMWDGGEGKLNRVKYGNAYAYYPRNEN